MRTLVILIILVLLVVAGAVAFIYSGAYDVAATSPHSKLVRWALSTTMDRSVESRAGEVQVPGDLSNPARIREGAAHYVEGCEGCHAGPGVERSPVSKGLYPPPPNLVHSGKEMSPQQLFWVIDHGVKDTGMPAFGPTHDDQAMWSMTAFIKALPTMSAADYAKLKAEVKGQDHEGEASQSSGQAAAATSEAGQSGQTGQNGQNGQEQGGAAGAS